MMAGHTLNLFVAVVVGVFAFAVAKRYHPIPTYFWHLHENGTMVDRNSPDWDREIKSKPWVNKISREDATTITLEANPKSVKNGGKVTVTWKGVTAPTTSDWIAFYCPYYDDSGHYMDYIWTKSVAGWKTGAGHFQRNVYNMRNDCVFKFYRSKSGSYDLAAVSNKISFADGGEYAPLQGHISMTNKDTEMRVMWNSGQVKQPPVVRYGLDKSLNMKEHRCVTRTYTKDSMCQSPANAGGFFHPGIMYDILLQGLTPNTFYYYSYGTEDYMSPVANFTTPLPKGDHTPYKFIVYGDMGVDPYPQGVTTANNVRRELDENNIKFIFHAGDISYARGYAYLWEQWFYLIRPYATLVPYMVGIGNHEYDHSAGGLGRDLSEIKTDGGWKPKWFNGNQDSGGECGVPTSKRFHMPDNGRTLYWYSYDYGMVHMIMMSTEHDYSPGSDQYIWLDNDLKNVDRKVTPWVMIAGHRPMYCSVKYYSDFVVATFMQKLFEELLYKYKVDIAFWAHYHSYERTCKLYKNKCVDDGVVHIVVGSAGKSKDIAEWYPEPWSIFRISDYGYGRVTAANASALHYEFILNSKDKVIDDVWLHHE